MRERERERERESVTSTRHKLGHFVIDFNNPRGWTGDPNPCHVQADNRNHATYLNDRSYDPNAHALFLFL